MPSGTHEIFDRETEVKIGSERSFGMVMTAFFVLVAAVRFWKGEPWAWLPLPVAGIFLCLALFWTAPLKPLNRLWFKFGLLLHKIVNPIVMGLLFYLAVTPMAILLRMLRKDLLKLRRDDAAESYWIPRQPPGPTPESMKSQF